MRKHIFLLLSLLFATTCCNARTTSEPPHRILFVGNSLTYVGNLPAVLSAMARNNGKRVQSYMTVSPGGTLSERVTDQSAVDALRQCRCDTLILQERGGDLFGLFGDDAVNQSKRAIAILTQAGHANGAKTILLGTYNSPSISRDLMAKEAEAAREAGIPYIAVSGRLWRLHKEYPSLKWLRKAGNHPGKALTLLEATLLYKHMYGAWPATRSFTVHAPIYGVKTGLQPGIRHADAPPPSSGVPRTITYSTNMVRDIISALEAPDI